MNAIWPFCIVVGLLMLEGGEGEGRSYWEMLREGGRVVDGCGGDWIGWMDRIGWRDWMDGLDGTFLGLGWELRRID
jgi:hypothetical protein